VKTVAFFNTMGGVGTTSLVAHLAWMFAYRGVPVLAVDLDPQSSLTSVFLTDTQVLDRLSSNRTVAGALQPVVRGTGDVAEAQVDEVTPGLFLLPGDLRLAQCEDLLGESWIRSLTGDATALRVLSAFHQIISGTAAGSAHPSCSWTWGPTSVP
jgi:cellulose biosynthesis protein BcsQ